jgi:hypothetical protein
MVVGRGFADRYLTDDEVRQIVRAGLDSLTVDGKRVLIIIPDGTRTMPMPLMFGLLEELLAPRVTALDYLVALGTHPPLSDAQLSKLVGRQVTNGSLHACQRPGPVRPGHRGGDSSHSSDAGHGHPAGTLSAHQPWLPRSGDCQPA